MRGVSVVVENKPGALADISYILGKNRMNIESISVVSLGKKAVMTLIVKNADKVEKILKQNNYKISSTNTLFLRLIDKPGALAEITKVLSDEKVNLKDVHIVSKSEGKTVVALSVDRPLKAKRLLDAYIVKAEDVQ
ncbi:ACT domain-containing protein [Candidatus Micrarchaeota archaeon]|nr:ACT domain-containing protein [Candidatus Micrarchaeota archaeon]